MGEPPALSRSASLVLGLAATALPFAQDNDEEAERWLRILRTHGEASLVLASVGVVDSAVAGRPGSGDPDPARPTRSSQPHPSDRVARLAVARRHDRCGGTVTSEDLLAAVMDAYGESFDRALERDGGDPDQLRRLLGFDTQVWAQG